MDSGCDLDLTPGFLHSVIGLVFRGRVNRMIESLRSPPSKLAYFERASNFWKRSDSNLRSWSKSRSGSATGQRHFGSWAAA